MRFTFSTSDSSFIFLSLIPIDIDFNPLEEGVYVDTLKIYSNDIRWDILLFGEILVQEPDINVLDESLDFGDVSIGDISTSYFEVINSGLGDLVIDSLTTTTDIFQV